MSAKYNYYRSVSAITTHALLHLYSEMSKKKQFYPTLKRNAILSKWLKARIALPGYKVCKSEIKTAIKIGKGKGSVEVALLKMNETNEIYRKGFTEADELYILLLTLYEQHGIASMTTSKELDAAEDGVIYMTEQEKLVGFNSDLKQVKPLKVWMKGVVFADVSELVMQASPYHVLTFVEKVEDITVFEIKRKGGSETPVAISALLKRKVFEALNDGYCVYEAKVGRGEVVIAIRGEQPKILKTVKYKLVGEFKSNNGTEKFIVKSWEKIKRSR